MAFRDFSSEIKHRMAGRADWAGSWLDLGLDISKTRATPQQVALCNGQTHSLSMEIHFYWHWLVGFGEIYDVIEANALLGLKVVELLRLDSFDFVHFFLDFFATRNIRSSPSKSNSDYKECVSVAAHTKMQIRHTTISEAPVPLLSTL